jgi:hypothetical protein
MRCNYPDNYDDSWFDEEHKCSECANHEDEKEHMRGIFGNLLEILYEKESIPLFKLHEILDELGAYVGNRDLPEHLPPVVRMNELGRELHNIPSSKFKS